MAQDLATFVETLLHPARLEKGKSLHRASKLPRQLRQAPAASGFEGHDQAAGHVGTGRKTPLHEGSLEVAAHLTAALTRGQTHNAGIACGEMPDQRIDVIGRCEHCDEALHQMRYHDGAIGRDRIQHRRNNIIGRQ